MYLTNQSVNNKQVVILFLYFNNNRNATIIINFDKTKNTAYDGTQN